MKLSRDWTWVVWILLAAPLFLLLAGVPVRLLVQPGGWDQLLGPAAMAAIRVSLWTSFLALVTTVLLGTPLAWWLARGRVPLRRLAESLIELPVVLPPAAAGIGLLLLFGRQGWVGSWLASHGLPVVFTPAAVVLAQIFVASPLFVRSASSAFSGLDREVEHCAFLDGASRLEVMWHISLPLARKGLFGGLLLCWARAIGEFGATILFAGNFEGRTQTMPLAIYTGFEQNLDSAIAMSRALLLVALAILLIAKLVDK